MRILTALIATALILPAAMAQSPAAAPINTAAATSVEKHSAHRKVSPQAASTPKAPATKTAAKPLDKHSAHRRVAAAPVAPAEPAELDEHRMAVVPRVMVGEARCDAGKTVSVQPHSQLPGRFVLAVGKEQHTVTPQPTSTGVIRLENAHAGVVWLQVPVKSMMMDAKRGQRLADNCIHPEQAAEVEAMKAEPTQ
jgi:hypothetical protein